MLRNGRWIWLVMVAVIIVICLQTCTHAQVKSVRKQIPIAKDSIEETLLILKGMVAARNLPPTSLEGQLNSIKDQLEIYDGLLKKVKTKEDFEALIPRISSICYTFMAYDRMTNILSSTIRKELDIHLEEARNSIDQIVKLNLKENNKPPIGIIASRRDEFSTYYMNILNYHINWEYRHKQVSK